MIIATGGNEEELYRRALYEAIPLGCLGTFLIFLRSTPIWSAFLAPHLNDQDGKKL